jgi:hypothetical protein
VRRVVQLAVLALAALAPLAVGANVDLLNDMVLATAYVVMRSSSHRRRVRGLLDLGYVALYALGLLHGRAPRLGLLGRFRRRPPRSDLRERARVAAAGIHVNFLLVFPLLMGVTTLAGASPLRSTPNAVALSQSRDCDTRPAARARGSPECWIPMDARAELVTAPCACES